MARKSIPTVGYDNLRMYMGAFIEAIMNVLFDDAGLPNRLVAEEDDFDFDFACDSAD